MAYYRYRKKLWMRRRLKRYAEHLIDNFENEIDRLKNNKNIMIIQGGEYDYTFFNICYLNNMLGLALLAMYKGYLPIFEKSNSEKIGWEWYFSPLEEIWGKIDGYTRVYMKEKDSPYSPSFDMLADINSSDFHIWSSYAKYVLKLNPDMLNYLREDIAKLPKFDSNFNQTIGLLLRGTDYTKMKPSSHPIQPEPEEICDFVSKILKDNNNYKYIYVATEEKKLFDFVKASFPNMIIIENKRHYIDDIFYSNNFNYVSDVKLGILNENYSRGVEYLSSLLILSRCCAIITGISGGSCGALMIRGNITNCHIIYKGKY